MQLRIHFENEISRDLYEDYSEFLFDRICEEVHDLINPRKYKVREPLVLSSSVIKWVHKPQTIDLESYVERCLELVIVEGEFVIRVDPRSLVRGSRTRVLTLIRLLEYGSEVVPPYKVVTRVLLKYSKIYKRLLLSYLEERLSE